MEFARTSGLSECKKLRSSESRWPRPRAVVGPRPKAVRHPAGEPENGRQLPGVKRIFRHPSSMCWSRWNIHLPSTTYLSIDLYTYPTTYLPKSIYPSIYLSLASRGIDCSRPCPLRPGRPWSHGTAGPRPFHWTPKALAWKARPSMASFGLRLRSFLRQRTVTFRPAGESRGCPTTGTQGDPLAATPFAGGLPGWGWPPARWTPTAHCVPELGRWRTVAHPAPRAENHYILYMGVCLLLV